jgi:hypothetical protein
MLTINGGYFPKLHKDLAWIAETLLVCVRHWVLKYKCNSYEFPAWSDYNIQVSFFFFNYVQNNKLSMKDFFLSWN